jgi:hypothetical protein
MCATAGAHAGLELGDGAGADQEIRAEAVKLTRQVVVEEVRHSSSPPFTIARRCASDICRNAPTSAA